MKKLNNTEKTQMCLNALFDICFYDNEFNKYFNEYASQFELDDNIIIELLESNYDNISEETMKKIDNSNKYILKYINDRKNSSNSEKLENINLI